MHIQDDFGARDHGVTFGSVNLEQMDHVGASGTEIIEDGRATFIERPIEQDVDVLLRDGLEGLHRIGIAQGKQLGMADPQSSQCGDIARAVIQDRVATQEIDIGRSQPARSAIDLLEIVDDAAFRQNECHVGAEQMRPEDDRQATCPLARVLNDGRRAATLGESRRKTRCDLGEGVMMVVAGRRHHPDAMPVGVFVPFSRERDEIGHWLRPVDRHRCRDFLRQDRSASGIAMPRLLAALAPMSPSVLIRIGERHLAKRDRHRVDRARRR